MKTMKTILTYSIVRTTLVLLILGCGIGYQVATLSSLHLHLLPDGTIVVHSHATRHTGSSGKHQHTDNEYFTLNALTRSLDQGFELTVCDFEYVPKVEIFSDTIVAGEFTSRSVDCLSNRAPPLPV